MKRPLIPVALLYVAGILLAALPVPLVPLFVVAVILLNVFIAWPAARRFSLAALIILTGWINLVQRDTVLSPQDLRTIVPSDEAIASVRGVLRETPSHRIHESGKRIYSTSLAQFDVREIQLGDRDWQPAFGRIIVTAKSDLSRTYFASQLLEIDGVLKEPSTAEAEGLFDYHAYLANQGIYYELTTKRPEDWHVIGQTNSPPFAYRFRAWARSTIAMGLPSQDESLFLEWALTLGWKTVLTDQVTEPFIQAATYHIFAVDGLRVAIIAGILFGLMRTLRVPRTYCALLTAPFLLFYAAMTGWPASAIRAIVMALVVFGGWILKRPSDLINSLFAAALIILVWEPRQLFQAGFQLSFFVVLCIILILPFFQQLNERILQPDPLLPESLQPRWKRLLRTPVLWVIDLFLTSLAAWLGSIPLVAYYFHIVTPCSGPANVLAVPLCALVLICNLASLFFGAWLPAIAVLFNYSGWFWMECIRHTSQWSAHWPAAYFYVPMPSLFTIGLYYFALISIFTGWLFKNPFRIYKIAALVLLCGVWCGLWLRERPATCLTILPVENGCAAYLRSHHSSDDWLIDCGNESSADMVTVPFLRAQGVNRLSHLFLTHGNAAYIGGAESILTNFHPAQVLLNPIESRSPEYRKVESFVQTHLPTQPSLKVGDHFGPWTVLHPDATAPASRAEDNAIVLLGQIDGVRVLLLSHLGHEGQLALLSRTNDLHADILVAAADQNATSDAFSQTLLDAIHPRVIIIHDTVGHPAGGALTTQLSNLHVPVLYTHHTQSVTLTTHPGRWQLAPMNGQVISN